ncbi:unnamed protein product [Notodromas monacha]|uniref:DNA repair protein RAD51 homolog 3 n=1 Tax=Notodromas monacha TaxID=399045 RepID=A0A7R9GA29_9CRUS|nr:unnamed protein product [Notodromas monacha]CAG0914890.1 unnamed protein product [Notodromas monacha]
MNFFVPTGISTIDDALRGGIPLPGVTEIFGEPGCGKTRICMEICKNAMFSSSIRKGGVSALFIDTVSTFRCTEFREMLRNGVEQSKCMLLSPTNMDELLAVIAGLRKIAKNIPSLGVVAIDCFGHPFRCSRISSDQIELAKILNNVHQDLLQASRHFGFAVGKYGISCLSRGNERLVLFPVLTNQLTVDMKDGYATVPALGESWGQCAGMRLEIVRGLDSCVTVNLFKSPFGEGVRSNPSDAKCS